MKRYIISAVLFLSATTVAASGLDIQKAFTLVSKTFSSESSVPAVYEYQFPEFIESGSVAVFDVTDNTFVQHAVRTDVEKVYEKSKIVTSLTGVEVGLNDDNADTSVDFPLPDSGLGIVDIMHTYKKENTAKRYYVKLAPNVRMPQTVTIFATNEYGKEEVVLAPIRPINSGVITDNDFIVSFPETSAKKWRVQFTYTQPLRIQDLGFVIENPNVLKEQYIRFLHQPNHVYKIYGNPDRDVRVPTSNNTNLTSMKDVHTVGTLLAFGANALYVVSDRDADGIPDTEDNCQDTANIDQADVDDNGVGDACDDFDRDGAMNVLDNCPNIPNPTQVDEDADGVGDACDTEDSRLTEKYVWIPWVGLGFAVLVLIGMFTIVIRRQPQVTEEYSDI